MIPIKVRVRRSHRLDRSSWPEVSRVAWDEAAAHWHEKIAAKHFDVGAFREYLYAARTRKYEQRKQRRWGHRRPLVWSGELERSVLRQRQVRTFAGRRTGGRSGGAEIRLRIPAHVRRGRTGPNVQAELAAISNRDAQALARVVERTVAEQLNRPGPTQEV